MQSLGLPKSCLLRKNQEFTTVYRNGRRLHGEGFSLIYVANDLAHNRIGISISRKVKGAVVRNRIKRIFKESFRLNRDIYPGNADIIVAVRPDFSLNSPDLIAQAIKRLVARDSR